MMQRSALKTRIALMAVCGTSATVCMFTAVCRAEDPAPDVSASTPANVRADRQAYEVPFTLGRDGRIYVQAKMDDKVTATLLFNTGNDFSTTSYQVYYGLDLPKKPVPTDGTSAFGNSPPDYVTPSSVLLGSLQMGDTPLIILPDQDLPQSQSGFAVDGELGAMAIDPFAFLIDFPGKRLYLWRPGGLTPAQIRAMNLEVAYTIPIHPTAGSWVWAATARVSNDKTIVEQEMLIDTGAMSTTISHDAAQRLGLYMDGRIPATFGLDQSAAISHLRVPVFRIGDFKAESLPVFYPSQDTPGLRVALGVDFYTDHDLMPLVDYAQKTLYLCRLRRHASLNIPAALPPPPAAGKH